MTCYGHFLIDVKDKVTKKYHPIRFYMMNTDVPRILISHAASYWTSSSASTSQSTSPELLEMERSFNSLLAGTRETQTHPVMRSQMDNLRDQ